jgi:hypothetical protein
MEQYPKIKSVEPLVAYRLKVTFLNEVVKIYDCTHLLTSPTFFLLRNPAFFRLAQVDRGGYGIFWNDDLDLSESELWLHGQPVEAAVEPTPTQTATT